MSRHQLNELSKLIDRGYGFARSFKAALQNSGRSSGEREVTMFPSTTAASSTTFAPAFLKSVLTEGQPVVF